MLVDANLLVYASVSSLPQHGPAHQWLEAQLRAPTRLALPWESLLAYARLVTNPRVFERPLPSSTAWRQIQAWLSAPNVWVPLPTEQHAAILGKLLAATGATANLIPDAHLAAIAIGHGLELASTDGDFARFAGLRWTNPLATAP